MRRQRREKPSIVDYTHDDDVAMSTEFDRLQKFLRLPVPAKENCSDKLQEKINKSVALKRQGISFNVAVRNRKEYRNPDFLRNVLIRYEDIDEIGVML